SADISVVHRSGVKHATHPPVEVIGKLSTAAIGAEVRKDIGGRTDPGIGIAQEDLIAWIVLRRRPYRQRQDQPTDCKTVSHRLISPLKKQVRGSHAPGS